MKLILYFALIALLSVVADCQQQSLEGLPDCGSGNEARIEPQLLTLQAAQVPDYPALARQARIAGRVDLVVGLRHGKVICVSVTRTDPMILGNAAKRNVESWKFADGTGYLEVTYIYQLSGEETLLPQIPHVELDIPRIVKITAQPTKQSCQDCEPKKQGS